MKIGVRALKERICLLKRKLKPDNQGGFQEEWQSVSTVWARVLPLYTQVSRGIDIQRIKSGSIEVLSLGYKVVLHMHWYAQKFERIKWNDRILAITTRPEIDVGKRFVTLYASELNEVESKNND